MVPPEELEKTQPTTLPADFSEWDSGESSAPPQPESFNGYEAVPRPVAAPKPAVRPATARVAVAPVVDRTPRPAAPRPAAPVYPEPEPFQPRRAAAATPSVDYDDAEETPAHKKTGMFVAIGAAALLVVGAGGYFAFRPKPVAVRPPVATQATTTITEPQMTMTDVQKPAPATPSNPAATAAMAQQQPTPDTTRPLRAQSEAMNSQLNAPSRIPNDLKLLTGGKEAAPTSGFGAGMEGMGGTGNVFSGQSGPKVKFEGGTRVISAGVAGGLLIQRTSPVYPQIAKEARISGTVVIQATISKTGAVTNPHAVSGPSMLQGPALDAVRRWRYRPYVLDGEPVEVQTTVSVTFAPAG